MYLLVETIEKRQELKKKDMEIHLIVKNVR